MYYIALCDDSPQDLKLLGEYLNELKKRRYPMEVLPLESGKELIELHRQGHKFDLLVLDMCMQPLNGIETAMGVRRFDAAVPILIVTATSQFAVDGYRVNAKRYLLKPVDKEEFLEEVEEILQRTARPGEEYYTFASENGVTRVRHDDIYYFESQARTITLHAQGGSYSFSGRIRDVAQQLEAFHFVRVHKSYVVNLKNVRNLYKDQITLENGAQIPFSKDRSREIHRLFLEYSESEG